MAKHGKKYQDAAKLIEREQVYAPAEAVDLAKRTSYVTFDPTIEAHLNLGVDPRHADQMVRGTVALATPDMMGQVGKLGKILGRRGLMPNPKSGTITFDVDRAVRELKAGRVEFKVDKGGLIHVAAGKGSFEAQQLVDNLAILLDAVNRAKPAGAKGQYLKGLTIASSMGPGIKVDISALLALAAAS
jgi:large subunit ribosomal protein L1